MRLHQYAHDVAEIAYILTQFDIFSHAAARKKSLQLHYGSWKNIIDHLHKIIKLKIIKNLIWEEMAKIWRYDIIDFISSMKTRILRENFWFLFDLVTYSDMNTLNVQLI